KIRPDFADVRVFGPSGERPRIIEPLTTARTELCFRLERALAAGASDNGYELHYGDPNAALPPNAMPQIFDFYDDFDGTSLATRWQVTGSIGVAGGILTLDQNSQAGVTMNA